MNAPKDSHPLPWRVEHFGGEFWIKDANGGIVTTVTPKYPRSKTENDIAEAAAIRIVNSVNGSSVASSEREELVEAVAIALCKHSYPARTIDEAVSPNCKLWQRLIPEAEIAVGVMLRALPLLKSGG